MPRRVFPLMNTTKPKLGDLVHFVLNTGPNTGAHRPAIVVKVVDGESVNLQVFTDGTRSNGDCLPNVFWKRGAVKDNAHSAGTWHWSEEL